MGFENIDNCFAENKLRLPNLSLLTPDGRTYEMLLLQPEGKVLANNSSKPGIGCPEMGKKIYEFLKLAKSKKVELAVTPEYSCLWSVFERILSEETIPDIHNIWIIGCESITIEKLNTIRERNKQYKWIFDESILEKRGKFVNPVCYLFNTYNTNEDLERIILIQFKTEPMGDGGIGVERDYMIAGNKIYYIRNDEDSIHLATLICSDTNGFEYNILKRLLLIHIQLNSSPNHGAFKMYRNKCFDTNASQDQIIVCLNWARQTEISVEGTSDLIEINYPNSAYYSKGNITLAEDRICKNHSSGLYYTYWKLKCTHVLFFNFDEHVFHLRCTKPWQGGAIAATDYKTGPEMLNCYSWNNGKNSWRISEELDAGIALYCEGCPDPGCPLKSNNLTPINKERLVSFSTGLIEDAEWWLLEKINSVQIDDNEIIKRFTFAQNIHNEVEDFRKGHLDRFHTLKTEILTDESNFPNFLKFLYGNCCLWYDKKHTACNLYREDARDSDPIALVVYIGETRTPLAEEKYNKIVSLLDECDKKTFLLWYRTGGKVEHIDYGLPGACDAKGDPRSITEV